MTDDPLDFLGSLLPEEDPEGPPKKSPAERDHLVERYDRARRWETLSRLPEFQQYRKELEGKVADLERGQGMTPLRADSQEGLLKWVELFIQWICMRNTSQWVKREFGKEDQNLKHKPQLEKQLEEIGSG